MNNDSLTPGGEPAGPVITKKGVFITLGLLVVAFVAYVVFAPGGVIDSWGDGTTASDLLPPGVGEKCGLTLVSNSGNVNQQQDLMLPDGSSVVVQAWTATNGQYVGYSNIGFAKGTVWCPGDFASVQGIPTWRAWDGVKPSWCDATDQPMNDGIRQCQAAIGR